MDRLRILTDCNEFLKVFPHKKHLVRNVVNSEMLLLFTKIRKDTDFSKIIKTDTIENFKASINNFFGEPHISKEKFGLIEGVFYTDHLTTDEEYEALYKLLKNKTKFQEKLYNLHPPVVKAFLINNGGSCCSNMLLHCTDAEFIDTLNSINFPITTVSNMLTALRSDLVLGSDKFGRIRTDKDVFVIDIPNSINDCVGSFISEL